MLKYLILVLFTLANFPSKINGSAGDRDPNFIRCIDVCTSKEACIERGPLPTSLTLFGWGCTDICKYECMMQVTKDRIRQNLPVYQYYGKWPFYRFLGIQEPASVVFSLMNLYVHLDGRKKLRSTVPNSGKYRNVLINLAYVQLNSWVWSSVFHTRDLPWTEKMDYFSAILNIFVGTYYSIYRVFNLRDRSARALANYILMFYIFHVCYLTFYKFDYQYNAIVGVVFGITHNLVWIYYGLKNWKNQNSRLLLAVIFGLTASMSLEIFDFPPFWFVFDAHSLWHLATVPISYLFYKFHCNDIKEYKIV